MAAVFALSTVPRAPQAFASATLEPTGGTLSAIAGTTPRVPGVTQFVGGLVTVRFPDGTSGFAYGLDLDRELVLRVPYDEAAWSDTPIPAGALSTVASILRSHGPDQGYTDDVEVMAVQAAIWHITAGFTLDPSATAPATVALYDSILAAAADPANVAPQPPPSLAFTPAQASGAEGQLIAFTVDGANWAAPTELTVTGTNPGGDATIVSCTDATTPVTEVTTPGSQVCVKLMGGPNNGVGTVGLRATTARAAVASGRVFEAVDSSTDHQRLMQASTVSTSVTAFANAVFQTNRGSITVEKLLVGNPGPGEVYTIEIRIGSSVVATHDLPDDDAGAGAFQHVFEGLLAGTYTVAELPGTPGRPNSAATVEVTGGGTITFAPGENPRVVVTNRYEGRLQLSATVSGGPATGRFSADVSCSLGAALVYAVTQIPLDPAAAWVSEPLPASAVCLVTESETAGAQAVTASPPGPAGVPTNGTVVTIANNQTVSVNFDNAFPPAGAITATVALAGPVTGPFTVAASCSFQGRPVSTGAESGTAFDPDHPWRSGPLPSGSLCVVSQIGSGDAEAISVAPPGGSDAQGRPTTTVVVPSGGEAGVTFTNAKSQAPLRFGALTIAMATTEGTGTGPFTFTASCAGISLAASDATFVVDTDPVSVVPASHVFATPLPGGTVCTITETDRAGAVSSTVAVDAAPAQTLPADTSAFTVTIGGDTMRTARVTNVMPRPPVGEGSAPAVGPLAAPGASNDLAFTGVETTRTASLALALASGGWALLVLARNVRRRTGLPASLA